MPHIAKTLNSSWDVAKVPVVFARITGKGNIRRYREFFTRFSVRVNSYRRSRPADHGFDHIAPDDAIKVARDNLLAKVDELIVPDDCNSPSAKNAKDAHDSGELRACGGV